MSAMCPVSCPATYGFLSHRWVQKFDGDMIELDTDLKEITEKFHEEKNRMQKLEDYFDNFRLEVFVPVGMRVLA